ncbi:MAG: ArnT family glycosyltransferase [Candidatus Saccharimonadales bacterium]
MNIRPVSDWTFYRYRFVIGYAILTVIAALFLTLYLNHIPPGLSENEAKSVVTSTNLQFNQPPTNVIDLPYQALQKLSVEFFGLTPIGVRLPSLVFAGLAVLFLSLLLRRWFPTNVAIVSSGVIVTSGWFLSIGRLGTPFIMIPFWTSLLLLTATYVSQQTKGWRWWKVVFAFATALSLYTPFMAYFFVAALLATISQPHLRYLLRESNATNVSIGTFFFVAVLAPLGWGVYNNWTVIRDLLGIPAQLPDPLQFGADLLQAFNQLFNPFIVPASELVLPLTSLGVTVILLIGLIRLLTDFHSVRAYMLLIWLAILLPIIGFNPDNLTVLFVPLMLLVAIGLYSLVRYWYRLFPRNPYARVFGLLPIAILLASILHFNYDRYFFYMLYSPQAAKVYQSDPFLAQQTIAETKPTEPVTVVAPEEKQPIYQILETRPNIQVTPPSQANTGRAGTWIVAESEVKKLAPVVLSAPKELIVNDHTEDALRFRVYQR